MDYKKLKEIPYYEIYEDGTVWRIAHRSVNGTKLTRRLIKPYRAKNHYLVVAVHDSMGKKKQIYLHRLVYMAFMGEIPKGHEIDHIDGDRSNNNLSNLRLCSHKSNCNNPTSLARYRISNALDKGKYDWDRMKEARSKEREDELKELYYVMLNEKGNVQLWSFMKRGHCNYYRACRIINEMRENASNMGVA